MVFNIKFFIDTKAFGLKIESKVEGEMNWNLRIAVTVIGKKNQKQD
jgi:hypothetical protein